MCQLNRFFFTLYWVFWVILSIVWWQHTVWGVIQCHGADINTNVRLQVKSEKCFESYRATVWTAVLPQYCVSVICAFKLKRVVWEKIKWHCCNRSETFKLMISVSSNATLVGVAGCHGVVVMSPRLKISWHGFSSQAPHCDSIQLWIKVSAKLSAFNFKPDLYGQFNVK